jgi:hypothetical protein
VAVILVLTLSMLASMPKTWAVPTHFTVSSREYPAVPKAATSCNRLEAGSTMRWRRPASRAPVTSVTRRPVTVPGSQCSPLHRQRATYDNSMLLWGRACVEGVVVAALPMLIAGWM